MNGSGKGSGNNLSLKGLSISFFVLKILFCNRLKYCVGKGNELNSSSISLPCSSLSGKAVIKEILMEKSLNKPKVFIIFVKTYKIEHHWK